MKEMMHQMQRQSTQAFAGRVNITSSCRDCDVIEKHPLAGEFAEENGYKIQYMFNGVKMYYGTYYSDWMNQIIYNLKGHHEPQEELCFHTLLKTLGEEANMMELGCWWCWYSIWFNKTITKPYNLCIEPVENFLAGGIKNAELNGCKDMEFAVGAIGPPIGPAAGAKVPQFRMDDLINGTDKFFDVIHSDIQGAEVFMLNSAKPVLDRIGYFVISTHGACLNIVKTL